MSTPTGLREQMLDRLANARRPDGPGSGSAPPHGHVAPRRPREPATVLIVDADEIVRLGVRAILSADKDLQVVGDAESVATATRAAASLHPAVAIIAGALPDGSVASVCARIRDAAPATRVMILARDRDAAPVVDAIRAGAAGYLTKDVGRRELCRAVRAIASGEVLIDSASTRLLLDGIRQGAAGNGPPETTPLAMQERRVLALVAQGKTNKEIATALKLSDKTVKNYLSHAFEKLNVSRRAQAAVLFIKGNGSIASAS